MFRWIYPLRERLFSEKYEAIKAESSDKRLPKRQPLHGAGRKDASRKADEGLRPL
jgi:hypothetical protein